jgi:hypothetical protein
MGNGITDPNVRKKIFSGLRGFAEENYFDQSSKNEKA